MYDFLFYAQYFCQYFCKKNKRDKKRTFQKIRNVLSLQLLKEWKDCSLSIDMSLP